MKNTLFIFCVLFVLISCTSVKNYNKEISINHPVKGLKNDVDIAYDKLQQLHPKLYQYIAKEKLDFKFDSLKNTLNKPITSKQFYEKIAPVIAEIRQGHISVTPPHNRFNNKEKRELKKMKFEFYQLEFEYLNDALWIVNTHNVDATLAGSKVLTIENDTVNNLIGKYKTLFSSDGYNTTFKNRFIGLRFSSFYYIDKGFKDSITLTLNKSDSTFKRVLRRIKKDSTLTKKNKDSIKEIKLTQDQKRSLKRDERQKRKDNYKYGFEKSKNRFTRNFELLTKDSTIAYIKIRGFRNGNYKAFYNESFAKIDSAKSAFLILDLRDNSGGRLAEIDKLYAFLTDKKYRFINKGETKTRQPFLKSMLSKGNPLGFKIAAVAVSPLIAVYSFFKSGKKGGKPYYAFPSAKIRKPDSKNFKGDIYVLINGNSYSASSILSTNLHGTKRATFVGEETGGAYNGTVAGLFKNIELPQSKVKIDFGLVQVEAPYKTEPDGFGIKPDVKIIPTIEDRLNNIDPELEWALEDIKRKLGL